MFLILDVLDMAGWWAKAFGFQIIIGVVLFLWNRKKSEITKKKPKENLDDRLLDWKPQPLVEEEVVLDKFPVMGKLSEGICNMGATSFLGFHKDNKIIDDSIIALRKYGVGSCGPRGFYGTIDVHLELEERLANFMELEEACVYSYGFSTIASAIPAYAKKGDLIFVDECVNFAIQKGMDASRSNIYYFKHNDMAHLEELLQKWSGKIVKRRSFIIAEGIYYNTGEMCPLPDLVKLRKKYKLRLILDESLTIGVIGDKGKGLTEHFNIPRSEVDLIVGSLEHSFASIGGFCVGSHFIVEHQRLSGLGYCFSASLPPLLTKAAISALDQIESKPTIMTDLRDKSIKLQKELTNLEDYRIGGDPLSPIKHLYIKSPAIDDAKKLLYLKKISKYCMERGVALSTAGYLWDVEIKRPEPSIRIASSRLLSDSDIDKLVTLLNHAYSELDVL